MSIAVLVGPPVVLTFRIGLGFVDYLDHILARSAPIASALASDALGREVRIGTLSPFLSVRQLWTYYKGVHRLGKLPIVVTDVYVANGVDLKTTGEFAYARRVTAYVSVPELLSGHANASVSAIDVESPRLALKRRANGSFNVQDLIKKKPGPPGPPFLTTVTIIDGSVRFLDLATKYPIAQTLDLYPVSGTATLGARSLRFQAQAAARPGSPTASRVSGTVSVSGSLAQGTPGTRPDAAQPTDPQYAVQLSVPDADARYWVGYVVGQIPTVTTNQGRARNVSVSLVGPTVAQAIAATAKGLKGLPPSVDLSAQLYGVQAGVKGVPTPISDLAGSVRYTSAVNMVSFDATANAFGEPVSAAGSAWDLTGQPSSGGPRIAVRFGAPHIPTARVVTAFKIPLPKNVSIGGTASASGFVTGTPNDLTGTASVFVPTVSVQGAATARNIAAELNYSRGVLDVPRVTASTDLGGSLVAQGRVHFGDVENDGKHFHILPASQIASIFSARAERVPLARLADLAHSTAMASKLKLTGTGNFAVAGSSVGTDLNLTGGVTTEGLSVGSVPFSVATAKVILRGKEILIPSAEFVSPVAGSVTVSGGSSLLAATAPGATPLSLRFRVHSLDAGRISQALGFPGVGGLIHATGTVTGTVAQPALTVDRLAVLNPQYKQYALQSVTASHLRLTRKGLVIPASSPIVARRFPASVEISGQVLDLLPAAGTRIRPLMALSVHASNIDYSTISPFLPRPKPDASGNTQQSLRLGGTLTQANLRVNGYPDSPMIYGDGTLRRLLIGDYPIEQGDFQFAYRDGVLRVPQAHVKASAGTLTAKATITRSGFVYGSFSTPALDLSHLSFLTDKYTTLAGMLSLTGTFSGTRAAPIVTLNIAPSNIAVAGVPINDLAVVNAQYIANIQRVVIPSISLAQAGGTRLRLTNGSYDLKLQKLKGTVSARTDSIAAVVDNIRQSGFPQTEMGKQLFDELDRLPTPFGGKLPAERPDPAHTGQSLPTNQVMLTAVLGKSGVTDFSASGDVYATGLQAGKYVADQIALTGHVSAAQSATPVKVKLHRNDTSTVDIARLKGEAHLNAEGIHIGTFVADHATINAALANAVATISNTSILSGSTTINASGTVGLGVGGKINALVDTNDASLDLARAFVPTLPVYGNVSLSISATGPTQSPDIAASLEGTDLVVADSKVATSNAAPVSPVSKTVVPVTTPAGTKLSLVRAVARILIGADKKRHLVIDDAEVAQAGGGHIEGDANVPFSFSAPYFPADDPIQVHLTLPVQDIRTLSAVQETPLAVAADQAAAKSKKKPKKPAADVVTGWTSGRAQGEISLTGTLSKPDLSGIIDITDGSYTFPQVNGHETMNALKGIDATLSLTGSKIDIDGKVTLAKPGGGNGDSGSATLTGSATVHELETTLSSLSGLAAGGTTDTPNPAKGLTSGTTLDLNLAFDKFQPDEENLFGLNEAIRGQIDGSLAISGPVSAPLIATPKATAKNPKDQPIVLSNVRIIPPGESKKQQTEKTVYPIDPQFSVNIVSPGNATLSLGGSLLTINVNAAEATKIRGSLSSPNVDGTFLTQGGVLNYYLRRFTLDKNDSIHVFFHGDSGGITMNDVVARTIVYLPPGTSVASDVDPQTGMTLGTSQPAAEGSGSRYKITADIKGTAPIGEDNGTNKDPITVTLGSDSDLTQNQILGLLVPVSMAQGNASNALQNGFNSALQSSLLPGLFSPYEQKLADTFGLESLSLDYASRTVNLSKRLPDPFERFIISYSSMLQSYGNRTTGGPLPYTVGLSYELYQVKSGKRAPLRIQIGVSTDEQNDFTSSLRAAITY